MPFKRNKPVKKLIMIDKKSVVIRILAYMLNCIK